MRNENGDFGGQAGQNVRVEIINMNLGVLLKLQDQSRFSLGKTFFGLSERKVYTGAVHLFNLLPVQTKVFNFSRFSYSPMNWQCGLSASLINEVVNVHIKIFSNWIPGDPIDSKMPKK